jgi:hypothetical protein
VNVLEFAEAIASRLDGVSPEGFSVWVDDQMVTCGSDRTKGGYSDGPHFARSDRDLTMEEMMLSAECRFEVVIGGDPRTLRQHRVDCCLESIEKIVSVHVLNRNVIVIADLRPSTLPLACALTLSIKSERHFSHRSLPRCLLWSLECHNGSASSKSRGPFRRLDGPSAKSPQLSPPSTSAAIRSAKTPKTSIPRMAAIGTATSQVARFRANGLAVKTLPAAKIARPVTSSARPVPE